MKDDLLAYKSKPNPCQTKLRWVMNVKPRNSRQIPTKSSPEWSGPTAQEI
jgi:hypothetical protein